jgi:hypothetical protein
LGFPLEGFQRLVNLLEDLLGQIFSVAPPDHVRQVTNNLWIKGFVNAMEIQISAGFVV